MEVRVAEISGIYHRMHIIAGNMLCLPEVPKYLLLVLIASPFGMSPSHSFSSHNGISNSSAPLPAFAKPLPRSYVCDSHSNSNLN